MPADSGRPQTFRQLRWLQQVAGECRLGFPNDSGRQLPCHLPSPFHSRCTSDAFGTHVPRPLSLKWPRGFCFPPGHQLIKCPGHVGRDKLQFSGDRRSQYPENVRSCFHFIFLGARHVFQQEFPEGRDCPPSFIQSTNIYWWLVCGDEVNDQVHILLQSQSRSHLWLFRA